VESFEGKIAVVTGGGTGMGRELVCQLIAAGAHVATCDVIEENLLETKELAEKKGTGRLTTHLCDVSDENQQIRFRAEVAAQHETDHIDLLFNNAGIGPSVSIVDGDRTEWERTFNVCWYGVYYGCTTFLPMLQASTESRIINTSSINGFWASVGPHVPHAAYCAAKFAVKGFTEALITDLRINAPNVSCSVVMPGHIGTSIVENSRKLVRKKNVAEPTESEVKRARDIYLRAGLPLDNVPDEHIKQVMQQESDDFRDKALTSAEDAASIILEGVKEKRWRILVGEDADFLDQLVRADPEPVYDIEFYKRRIERWFFNNGN
jgi:NAD(P)-dependent dehydrogenase (short-subunit alcohol dehydrogenase family)